MVLGNSGKGILKISLTESYCQVVIGKRSIGRWNSRGSWVWRKI